MQTQLHTTRITAKLLERLGLEQRRSALGIVIPGVGLLGAGIVFGIGLSLLVGRAQKNDDFTRC
jgi:hypothetical protein